MGTYTELLSQIVFGSKNHLPFLNRENEEKLFGYIAGICRNKKCLPYIVGGYRNHLHIIISIPPSIAISHLVKEIKNASSYMMKDDKILFRDFISWQEGFSAFSYQKSVKDELVRYVRNQKEHHKKRSFVEELVELYREFEVEFDLRYLSG
jgi:REP-associated tyrosine transposase